MISGIDLTRTENYTLKNDKDNPTIFKLGILPAYILVQLGTQESNQADLMFKLLQVGIKGWENFTAPYATTKEHMFGRDLDVVPLTLIELLPLEVVTELISKLLDVNKLTVEQQKN